MSIRLTENELEVLLAMQGSNEWLRPMDVGAWDSSHHSGTLKRLAAKGLVLRKRRYPGASMYLYQITEVGNAACAEWWEARHG
jgi:hypothetical protein